ncbi:MAG: spore germination protein [Symbiobacteriia bacterium]
MAENLALIKDAFGNTADLRVREVSAEAAGGWRVVLVYLEGLVTKSALQKQVIAAIQRYANHGEARTTPRQRIEFLEQAILSLADVERVETLERVVNHLLVGGTVLLTEGVAAALGANTAGYKKRSITESQIEAVVRGPRQGFIEVLQDNVALVRQILRTPRLRFTTLTLGQTSQTPVWVGYIEGQVDPRVLNEVEHRLRSVSTQAILESKYVEEYITDHRWSPFPLIDNTERPDRVAAALLEGRVAIFVAGTPVVLLAPTVLGHLLQSPEDYYGSLYFAAFARIMRTVGMIGVLTLPALYVALVSYHHEMIPTSLALALVAAQKNVPYPSLVEVLLLELVFEGLRESGLRLPSPAGQAVTIVGALILGQAAIGANLVTPMMVIIVTAAGIASFTMPNYQLATALRLLRFPLILLAGVVGFAGILCGAMILFFHLCSLRSFGVPYLTPLAPLRLRDLDNAYVRSPHWLSRGGFQLQPRRGPDRLVLRKPEPGGEPS